MWASSVNAARKGAEATGGVREELGRKEVGRIRAPAKGRLCPGKPSLGASNLRLMHSFTQVPQLTLEDLPSLPPCLQFH